MSNFILSCCSTIDLPLEYAKSRDLKYLCYHYTLDDKDYEDDLGENNSISEFYKQMSNGAQPTTSQISVGRYFEHFEELLKQGKPVLHISMSSGISGSCNSAKLARNDILEKYPDAKLIVVDSLAASGGYGMVVDIAADKRDEGLSYEEVAEYIEQTKLNVNHWFFSTDLTSYVRGGRVSPAAGWFGTLLHICPLLNVNFEGKLIPREKCRGLTKAIDQSLLKMVELADNSTDYDGKCFISNSGCVEDAEKLVEAVENKFPKLKGKILFTSIGTVIGSHTGPGTVALFFIGKKRED